MIDLIIRYINFVGQNDGKPQICINSCLLQPDGLVDILAHRKSYRHNGQARDATWLHANELSLSCMRDQRSLACV